jgi:hypothetical protein
MLSIEGSRQVRELRNGRNGHTRRIALLDLFQGERFDSSLDDPSHLTSNVRMS